MRSWSAVVLVGLWGCVYNRIPSPMYAEVIPGVTAGTVTFDEDGVLHALYFGSDGQLRYGSFDRRDLWTFGEPGPLTLDGAPLGIDRYYLDLAVRPGTDEVWAWIGGVVGRLEGDRLVKVLQLDSPTGQFRGGLAFEDEHTLHVGIEGGEWQVYPVEGDRLGTPEVVRYLGNPVPPCDLDLADGYAHARICGPDPYTFTLDLATREVVTSHPDWETDELNAYDVAVSGTIAVTEGFGWMQRPEFLPACVVETRDGFLTYDERHLKVQDDLCDPYDYTGPVPTFADVAPKGEAVAMAFYDGPLVMLSRDRPKGFEADKTGTWCPTVGYEGGAVEFRADGTFGWPGGTGTEILYPDRTWTQSKDKVVIDLPAPEGGMAEGDERVEAWALRVGDTLHLRTNTHERQEDHLSDSGFTFFSGIFTKCD